MNIYLISQEVNNGYDTYDSAVVCAKDESDARTIHPSSETVSYQSFRELPNEKYFDTWAGISDIKVELIGKAVKGIERGVICASFNAG